MSKSKDVEQVFTTPLTEMSPFGYEFCSSSFLYNSIFFYTLILDTRNKQEYINDHVYKAIHIELPEDLLLLLSSSSSSSSSSSLSLSSQKEEKSEEKSKEKQKDEKKDDEEKQEDEKKNETEEKNKEDKNNNNITNDQTILSNDNNNNNNNNNNSNQLEGLYQLKSSHPNRLKGIASYKIIVYGDEDTNNDHNDDVRRKLQQYQALFQLIQRQIEMEMARRQPVATHYKTIKPKNNINFYVLRESYTRFKSLYPFLCRKPILHPYPHLTSTTATTTTTTTITSESTTTTMTATTTETTTVITATTFSSSSSASIDTNQEPQKSNEEKIEENKNEIEIEIENENKNETEKEKENKDDINNETNSIISINESMYNNILGGIGYPCQVVENQLFIGDGRQATNPYVIYLLQITHIVNVTRLVPNAFSIEELSITDANNKTGFSVIMEPMFYPYYTQQRQVQYCKVPLEDTVDADIHSFFDETTQFIETALSQKTNRVLVHCQMGISRSATIVLAYLIKSRRMTLKDAFLHCSKCRKVVSPNEGFISKLVKWERKVFDGKDTLTELQEAGHYQLLDVNKSQESSRKDKMRDFFFKLMGH